jgi:diguanylate cyclase (GGDEF)-like protein
VQGNYSPELVALSIVVAIIASYTALDLAGRVASANNKRCWYWLICGALAMGAGIWSMHFIGMLAFKLPVPMAFDLPITLLSLLIAAIASGFALYTVRRSVLNARTLAVSAALIGIGISAMHYTGMLAMRMSPPIEYTPVLFVASVVIAIAASLVALLIAFHLRFRRSGLAILARLGSAVVMGFAISGMHYTGMAAANFAPGSVCLAVDSGSALAGAGLAVAVGISTLIILIGTLVVSSLDAHFAHSLHVANEQLRSVALYDNLTGLPNRMLMEDRLGQAINRAARSGKTCALLFLDLDGFKAVNDTLGHRAGDLVLQQAAERMARAVRKEDTVARLGGDEFVVVLSELPTKADVEVIARKLVTELGRPFAIADAATSVTASVGVSLYPSDARDVEGLLERADAAMYAIKHEGKNGVRFAEHAAPAPTTSFHREARI